MQANLSNINTSPLSDSDSELFTKVNISVTSVPGVLTLPWLKAWTKGAEDVLVCMVKMLHSTPASMQPGRPAQVAAF